MQDIPNVFGSMVFNDKVMKQRLPKDVYKALKRTMDEQKHFKSGCCQRRCNSHERMGHRKRSNPFYPLVPAPYRSNSRKA